MKPAKILLGEFCGWQGYTCLHVYGPLMEGSSKGKIWTAENLTTIVISDSYKASACLNLGTISPASGRHCCGREIINTMWAWENINALFANKTFYIDTFERMIMCWREFRGSF